jgi:hypothetical protein
MDVMSERELEIGKIIRYLSSKTGGFEDPKLVLIGGYALRHYVPFSRYSRDCDFALKQGIERIKGMKPANMTQEIFERKDSSAFMRWVKITEIGGKKVKTGVDFMEAGITGRENEFFGIDGKFLESAKKVTLHIGTDCEVFVPAYADMFLLKVMSARRSDIRDIAAMVWKNGIPGNIMERAKEATREGIVRSKLENQIIPEISDRLFMHSFRGTFVIESFGEKELRDVIRKLKAVI